MHRTCFFNHRSLTLALFRFNIDVMQLLATERRENVIHSNIIDEETKPIRQRLDPWALANKFDRT